MGAPAAGQLDVVQLLVDASPVVKLVLLALVLMSLVSWFIIGAKLVRLGQAARTSGHFLDSFWGGDRASTWSAERLEGIYGRISSFRSSPIAAVFRNGYVELARSTVDQGVSPSAALENVERATKRAAGAELTRLETMLPFLATTGATAPFVGLFGTVWGIMNSFISIRNEHNATLETVAPGIAEALIATAIGLAAAIPAVMAYNFFVRRIRVLESEIESFSSDYLNIVRRHFLRE